jgi:hypothetical protein
LVWVRGDECVYLSGGALPIHRAAAASAVGLKLHIGDPGSHERGVGFSNDILDLALRGAAVDQQDCGGECGSYRASVKKTDKVSI